MLSEIWPSQKEVSDAVQKSITSEMFRKSYADVYSGRRALARAASAQGRDLCVGLRFDLHRQALFRWHDHRTKPVQDITGARVLAVLGDSVTTDHISPAGSIKKDGPAGKYLQAHGCSLRILIPTVRGVAITSDGARNVCQCPATQQDGEHRRRIHAPSAGWSRDEYLRRFGKNTLPRKFRW